MNLNKGISTSVAFAIIIAVVIVAFGGVFGYRYLVTKEINPQENSTACTPEAKVCPDGSTVDRTDPNCEFAKCPTVQDQTTEVQTIESFILKGWQSLQTIEGDLNKDGLKDAVIVIEDKDHKTDDGSSCDKYKECPRSILILFQTKNGSYKLSIKSDKAILLAGEGGVFGDPFQKLKIDNGSLLINSYGGSNWRWSYSYRFRYQDNEWFLIGATSNNYFNVSDCVDKLIDYNFLTNKKKEIVSSKWDSWYNQDDTPCSREEKWSDIKSDKIINLEDFEAANFDFTKF